jgi:hypothetical protein
MFNTENIIDTIQLGKKQFVNTFVFHEGIKNSLHEFVDNQTAYTKAAVKSAEAFNAKLIAEMTKGDSLKFFNVGK